MAKNNQTLLIANSLSDVFYQAKSVGNLQILGGGTATRTISETALTVRSIHELKGFDKHEHYIDFGPAITLSDMLSIGRTNLPPVLYDALKTIATPAVRNVATLGGNILAEGTLRTLWGPLLALDARLEFRTQNETRYCQLREFDGIPKGFVLTKIRVPIDVWEVALFRRTGPSRAITADSSSFVFLADTDRNMLANLRIVLTGRIKFRSPELENRVIGARLPLGQRTATEFAEQAEVQFDKVAAEQLPGQTMPPMQKAQFLSLLRYSIGQLS